MSFLTGFPGSTPTLSHLPSWECKSDLSDIHMQSCSPPSQIPPGSPVQHIQALRTLEKGT